MSKNIFNNGLYNSFLLINKYTQVIFFCASTVFHRNLQYFLTEKFYHHNIRLDVCFPTKHAFKIKTFFTHSKKNRLLFNRLSTLYNILKNKTLIQSQIPNFLQRRIPNASRRNPEGFPNKRHGFIGLRISTRHNINGKRALIILL